MRRPPRCLQKVFAGNLWKIAKCKSTEPEARAHLYRCGNMWDKVHYWRGAWHDKVGSRRQHAVLQCYPNSSREVDAVRQCGSVSRSGHPTLTRPPTYIRAILAFHRTSLAIDFPGSNLPHVVASSLVLRQRQVPPFATATGVLAEPAARFLDDSRSIQLWEAASNLSSSFHAHLALFAVLL